MSGIIRRITRNGQITIPKEIRDDLGVDCGDAIEFVLTDAGCLLRPKKVIYIDVRPEPRQDHSGSPGEYSTADDSTTTEDHLDCAESSPNHIGSAMHSEIPSN